MRTIRRALTLLALAAVASPEVSGQAQSRPATTTSFSERYGVLAERNIFLRERRYSSGDREATSRPAPTTRPAEQAFILTGVVYEEGEFHAFVEDMNQGSVVKLRVGEPVARGRISQIQMDAIEYESVGGRAWVDVGQRLTGEQIAPVPGTQPSALPIDPNDPNLTIEQRMRLRRMQQLNAQ